MTAPPSLTRRRANQAAEDAEPVDELTQPDICSVATIASTSCSALLECLLDRRHRFDPLAWLRDRLGDPDIKLAGNVD
jgi:hypothetical protein